MHCPNCGSFASSYQQFCHTCGLNLSRFAQLLSEHRSTLKEDIHRQKRKFEKWALALWAGAGAILYIVLYWAIIRRFVMRKGHVLNGVLFLLVITAISVGGLFILYSLALAKRAKYSRSDTEEVSSDRETGPESSTTSEDESRPAAKSPIVEDPETEERQDSR